MPAKPRSSANQRLTKKASSPATRRPRRAAKSVKYSHSALEALEPQRPGILDSASDAISDAISTLSDGALVVYKRQRGTILVAAAALLAGVIIGSQALSVVSDTANRASRAQEYGKELESAVQVGWYYKDEKGDEYGCFGGSGTLIQDPATVLTAAHVVTLTEKDKQDCPNAYLQVGYAVDPRGEYFVWWDAEVQKSDEVLDIAVLNVFISSEPASGSTDAPGAVERIRSGDWSVRPIATSASGPNLGDQIHAFAYPAIGGYGATYTTGSAAGWSAIEDRGAHFEYLKLDMTAAGGSSGAGVLNASGELIGIVLQGGADYVSDTVDCRKVADTNEDGKVDDLDTCVPFGGFINAALSLGDIRSYLKLTDE